MDRALRILHEAAASWHPALISGISEKLGRDPYMVLVGTIMSLRTRDDLTEKIFPNLWRKARTPQQMIALGSPRIEKLIYPVGFYRTKARTLVEISRLLIENWEGQVPHDLDALLTLPGVGRKTANLVLGMGFGIPAICVDTHVHRISNRLGYIRTKDPDKTELALRKKLPPEHWLTVNETLVRFGQNICKPISPLCSQCPVFELCPRIGVGKSR